MHVVVLVPPTPASATYNSPSGPNFRPRGSLKPVATTLLVVTVVYFPPHCLVAPHGRFGAGSKNKRQDQRQERPSAQGVQCSHNRYFFSTLNVNTPAKANNLFAKQPVCQHIRRSSAVIDGFPWTNGICRHNQHSAEILPRRKETVFTFKTKPG